MKHFPKGAQVIYSIAWIEHGVYKRKSRLSVITKSTKYIVKIEGCQKVFDGNGFQKYDEIREWDKFVGHIMILDNEEAEQLKLQWDMHRFINKHTNEVREQLGQAQKALHEYPKLIRSKKFLKALNNLTTQK